MKYYSLDAREVLEKLESNENGLTENKARNLLIQNGKNELPKEKKDSIFKLFIDQFKNPMELLLIVTVILSFLANETIDAIALIFIILIDVIIGTYEEYKARKDAESLIDMIKVQAIVIRDNKEIEIDASELVIGDIVLLESGTRISADARIIECHNFQVDESSLTGESVAVVKSSDKLKENTTLSDRVNMVYAGTSVITGRAHAVVTATGIDTEIGHIADKVTNTKEEKSPLTIRLEKFTKQVAFLIIMIAIIITFLLLSKNYPVNEIFLCVIALSVSAMPEGLSLALTMALTIASKKMAKKRVIVKKLNSVESLGSCTVIASDKTGTLTVNEQTAKEIVLANKERFLISGTGYNAKGKVTCYEDSNIENAKRIAFLGKINNEAHLEKKHGKWISFGDSIDIAFLSLAEKLKVTEKANIKEVIPYESENGYSAVFYEENGILRCTVKGSLEKVMSFSQESKLYQKQNVALTKKGYRVIAIADGKVSKPEKESIKKLDFIGMVAFIDPVREEVKKSLAECKQAGIKVVMITGDHPLTAYAIAKDLGLCQKENEVATGKDLEIYKAKGEQAFDQYVSKIKVFSRVTPMDKLDIVNSYKRQGEFVAVTGDGVNDAPAIKAANIGIAMGSGTDVAKDTASMIVTDDNFTSIVEGVKEGRTAYSNIRKIILFLISCGIAEVLFFLLSIIFGYDMPLVAIQLLWLNIVTDGLQDIALSLEKTEDSIMQEKPRSTKESLFSQELITEIMISALTISLVVFGVWKVMMDQNVNMTIARSVIMMLMVFIQNVHVLNCRSEKMSVFKKNIFDNPIIIITIVSSILLQIIMAEIPITSKFLKVTPLSYLTIGKILFLSLIVILVFEIYKMLLKTIKKRS